MEYIFNTSRRAFDFINTCIIFSLKSLGTKLNKPVIKVAKKNSLLTEHIYEGQTTLWKKCHVLKIHLINYIQSPEFGLYNITFHLYVQINVNVLPT